MKIDLQSTGENTRDFEESIEPDAVGLDLPGVELKGPVQVSGRVEKGSDRLTISGKISGLTVADCTRCLESFERPLEFDFSADYVVPEHFSSDEEHQVESSDLDLDVLPEDGIDLTDLVREQILLEMPEKVLCREDCKGLCPKCGENRNLLDCSCDEKETDPRWAALKDLK